LFRLRTLLFKFLKELHDGISWGKCSDFLRSEGSEIFLEFGHGLDCVGSEDRE
jgi:hypothetical protein